MFKFQSLVLLMVAFACGCSEATSEPLAIAKLEARGVEISGSEVGGYKLRFPDDYDFGEDDLLLIDEFAADAREVGQEVTHLIIRSDKFRDEHLARLVTGLANMDSCLVWLDINGEGTTDEGLDVLAHCSHSETLKFLTVGANISEERKEMLRQELPNCDVL